MQRRSLLAGIAAGALVPAALRAQQPVWKPDRPIRIVVPFAAGGSTDMTARLVGEALSARLGQPVVIENRAGAGGNIASEYVARSAPDGYTLIMATTSTHATNAALYHNLPFDTAKDFAPVSLIAFPPNVLVVNPKLPVKTLQEFIDYAKANPGKLNYGSAGNGSSQHLSAAMLEKAAGIRMQHVPYRGGAPAVADTISGRVELVCTSVVEVLEYVRSGQLRALGVTTAKRATQMPEVPSISEILPGYELNIWSGLFAPAGTPAPAIARISSETATALRDPKLRERLIQLGAEPVGSTAEEFATFFAAELPKVAEQVRISGAAIE